jgi:hypothetical protein
MRTERVPHRMHIHRPTALIALQDAGCGKVALDAITEYYALAEGSPGSKQPDLPEGIFDDANGEEA